MLLPVSNTIKLHGTSAPDGGLIYQNHRGSVVWLFAANRKNQGHAVMALLGIFGRGGKLEQVACGLNYRK